ncbi:MAG: hypothetical protein H0T76_07285 [Nannocystis sp.]|nr:hypothetical protein [Nannocystis sp.]MBA3546266.1 hypothetical protein [Nannocystis sp.]
MRTALNLALSSALLACGGGGGTTSFGGSNPGVTSAPAQTETSAAESSSSSAPPDDSSTSTSAALSTSTGTSDSTVWDMGMPDFDPTQPVGCEGKVDFLFVISAMGTMKPMQQKLIASFPGFIDAIEAQLPDFDVHILVAKPDEKFLISDCAVCTTDCDPQGQPPYCGVMLTPCDKKIGAGLTFPSGTAASNIRCELDNGLRYITSDEPKIKDTFACMAQVGTGGSGRTGQAMVAALQPAMNDPNDEYACNGGFLRDDALLVVTIIQDTYDVDSLGTVDEWIAALRASKNYDDDAFMVLVLTTDIDVGYNQLCSWNEYYQTKNRLRLLGEGVEHGFVGSICEDNYAPFFAEHVSHLVDLCDEFVAPG